MRRCYLKSNCSACSSEERESVWVTGGDARRFRVLASFWLRSGAHVQAVHSAPVLASVVICLGPQPQTLPKRRTWRAGFLFVRGGVRERDRDAERGYLKSRSRTVLRLSEWATSIAASQSLRI